MPDQRARNSFLAEILTSGASVATASTCTNPMDVLKVRMQLHRTGTGEKRPPGLVRTASLIVREQGVGGLWRGVQPSILRGLTYGGLRLGLYGPIKQVLYDYDADASPLLVKVVAGSSAGGIAAALTSPLELVKTRQQAGGAGRSMAAVAHEVWKADGVKGLWRGAVPSMMRASALTVSQCVTYDYVKRRVMDGTGWQDGTTLHVASSMLTGLVATTLTNPVDVIKTAAFVAGRQYTGVLHAMGGIMQRDGPTGFFKGWTANYLRLGPQTLITFVVAEELRSLAGLTAL